MAFETVHRQCSCALLAVIMSGCAAGSPSVDERQFNLETGIGEADPELCPPGAIDSDGDQLCDAAEIRLGTDINNVDTDGDSLPDGLEVNGYKVYDQVFDLKALGANPLHKDVFLWIDYLAQFEPTSDALQRVIDAFAASPVENPDKTTGIHLRIDKGKQAIGAAEAPAYENITSISQFATLKNEHLEQGLWIVYHYAFFGKQYESGTSSGFSLDIPSTDFVVTLGAFVTQDAEKWTQIQAGTLMHELGHNLGLHHGGLSSSGFDDSLYKPTYFSVMNYNYQMEGVTRDQVNVLDYARVAVGSVNEQSLFERDGFPGLNTTTATDLAHYNNPRVCVKRKINRRKDIDICQKWVPLLGDAGSGLDFNRDQRVDQIRIRRTADLDAANGRRSVFAAVVDDWSHLIYHGGNGIGVVAELPQRNVADAHPTNCMEADTAAEPDDELTDNTTPPPDEGDTTATSTTPTTATTPTIPTPPTTPSAPTPTTPTAPSMPPMTTQPSMPSTPATSSTPSTTPSKTTSPTTPTAPTKPSTPTAPPSTMPKAPTTPSTPTTTPKSPSTPSTPTAPTTTTPKSPSTPSTPSTPGTPKTPSTPGTDPAPGDNNMPDNPDPTMKPGADEPTTPGTDGPTTEPRIPGTDPNTSPETDPNTPPETDPNTPPETDPNTPPETDPNTPPETDPNTPPETDPNVPQTQEPTIPGDDFPEIDPNAPTDDPATPPEQDPEPQELRKNVKRVR